MEEAVLSAYDKNELVIELLNGNQFQLKALEKDVEKIESIIFNLLNEKIKIIFQLNEKADNKKENQQSKKTEHPLFEKVIETFDGEIIR